MVILQANDWFGTDWLVPEFDGQHLIGHSRYLGPIYGPASYSLVARCATGYLWTQERGARKPDPVLTSLIMGTTLWFMAFWLFLVRETAGVHSHYTHWCVWGAVSTVAVRHLSPTWFYNLLLMNLRLCGSLDDQSLTHDQSLLLIASKDWRYCLTGLCS